MKSGLDQANLEHYVLLCDHLKSKSDEVMKNVIYTIIFNEDASVTKVVYRRVLLN